MEPVRSMTAQDLLIEFKLVAQLYVWVEGLSQTLEDTKIFTLFSFS